MSQVKLRERIEKAAELIATGRAFHCLVCGGTFILKGEGRITECPECAAARRAGR